MHDQDTIIVSCMFSSSCKPVPTTNLFENIDILYLLSHVNSVSLSMGRISSIFLFFFLQKCFIQNALVPVTEFSHSKFKACKHRHGMDNEAALVYSLTSLMALMQAVCMHLNKGLLTT